MPDLYLFSQEYDPLQATMAFLQDSATGWPVSSQTKINVIYRSTFPQRIRCAQNISTGQLLNIYFAPDNYLSARLASVNNKELYANALALGNGNFGDYIYCGIRSAVVPDLSSVGPRYLGETPGVAVTSTVLQIGTEIHQCVGHVANGFFHFEFHTPALVAPMNYLSLGE